MNHTPGPVAFPVAPAHDNPTATLYNEDAMLRLVLEWFSVHPDRTHLLSPAEGATWTTDAGLPTPFPASSRGGWPVGPTIPIDGVVGHVSIAPGRTRSLALRPGAHQLVIISATLDRPGTGRHEASALEPGFRVLLGMAEMLHRAHCGPADLPRLSHVILEPGRTLRVAGRPDPSPEAIVSRARSLAGAHGEHLEPWLREGLLPVLQRARTVRLEWESVIETVRSQSNADGVRLARFYGECLRAGSAHAA